MFLFNFLFLYLFIIDTAYHRPGGRSFYSKIHAFVFINTKNFQLNFFMQHLTCLFPYSSSQRNAQSIGIIVCSSFLLTDGSYSLLISLKVFHVSLSSRTCPSKHAHDHLSVWTYRERCMDVYAEWPLPWSSFQTWILLFNLIQMRPIVPS